MPATTRIRACVSRLLADEADLPATLARLCASHKPGGVFYLRFKRGEGERSDGERAFHRRHRAAARAMVGSSAGGRSSGMLDHGRPAVGAEQVVAEWELLRRGPGFLGKGRLDAAEREELLDIFLACCEWTRIYFGWRPNLPDEGDNHLVELAIAGGAHYIVTRNLRDVARMELKFPTLQVVSPEDFLEELSR